MSTANRTRPKLSEAALDHVATNRPAPEQAQEQTSEIAEEAAASNPKTASSRRVRPSRKRVAPGEPRGITVWVEPDVFKTLKHIGTAEDLSMREMMTEAIAGYLRKKKNLSIVSSPPPKA